MLRCRGRRLVFDSIAVLVVVGGVSVGAQISTNSYRAIYGWEKMPAGRDALGVVAGIYTDPDKKHIWMLTRCEANGNACLASKVDPVLKFDMNGNVVKSFGAGMFVWPHGFFVDHEGNVWVTEGAPAGEARGAEGHKVGKGHQVFKFSPDGKVLMTLGVAGMHGDDQTHFNGPSHVLVAPNGEIWVADGHRGGNNRVVKFTKDGKFIKQIGGGVKDASLERGRFNDPHHLAMDSRGRLYVSDRGNNRIQVFDQEGTLISVWTQFGRPSAIAIDGQDRIYVVDGTSASPRPLALGPSSGRTTSGNEYANNPGYESGIRIGDSQTGWITEFIPEMPLTSMPTAGGAAGRMRGVNMEFVGLDPEGNIFAGEVESQRLVKWVRVRK
jgi:hypothetical protein